MHLVIIGKGITGVTCAVAARKRNSEAQITVGSSESAHHCSRTALMYVYMGHLRHQDIMPYEDWFWQENRMALVHATATALHPDQNLLTLDNGSPLRDDQLLLATGSESKLKDWPGQYLAGVQGLYILPDLEVMTRDTHGISRAVVVGGGLIGVELAEMLHTRGISGTVLVRAPRYWDSVLPPEEAQMVDCQFQENDVVVHYNAELRGILGDAQGRVRAVVTNTGEEILCQWVGLAFGVRPNFALAKTSTVETDYGILVDEYLRTNVPNLYAAGALYAVVGFNAFGLRLRHDVCEQCIQQRSPLQNVMAHLDAANFDPEFFPQHEKPMVAAFNRQFPQLSVTLKQKKGLFARLTR